MIFYIIRNSTRFKAFYNPFRGLKYAMVCATRLISGKQPFYIAELRNKIIISINNRMLPHPHPALFLSGFYIC